MERLKDKKDSVAPEGAVVSKRCNICKKAKPLSAFNVRNDTKDKLYYRCKVCASRLCGERNKNNHREFKAYCSNYGKEHREKINARRRGEYAKDSRKTRSRARIKRMIRAGRISPIKTKQCDMCSFPAQEYHHPNYDKPDEVTPLCRACHSLIHRKYA